MTSEAIASRTVLVRPKAADRDWQFKIERAKAAREDGKAARANKPGSFRWAVGGRA